MKVIDYRIVTQEDTVDEFELTIYRMLEQGWQPLGGVSHGAWHKLTQVMVMYASEMP